MICFLHSSMYDTEIGGLNPANGFVEEIKACFPVHCRGLFVCSDPDACDKTDFYGFSIRDAFETLGMRFERYLTLDSRNEDRAEELIRDSDLIVLAGGHVPTQNRFFHRIHLRELLGDFNGILMGISAGSMNCAETVYAQPEEEGEAVDPDYQRFLPGLGLTKIMLLPHFQWVRTLSVDGLRVLEGLTYPDSMGKTIYAINDGSYLLIRDGKEELRGEAYRIRDGVMTQICSLNETVFVQG